MDFQLLLSALALMLIFEGLLPFASPVSARQLYAMMASQTNRFVRLFGAAAVGGGLLLLMVTAGG